jgi:Tfp pilus assembly protein PilX
MTRHPQARDDSGASLILALIVITVIATVVATLLSMADTSVRATVNLRDQAAASYTADGAIQAAVNNIRNSTYNAGTGQHCFGGSDTLALPANFSGTASAAVSCTADPSKVLIQCPSLSHCNRPGSAILTLGTSAG